MVKKNKFSTKFEEQLINLNKNDSEEEFIGANKYLENDALNEEEENFNENTFSEKNEQLIEKLKSLDGKKRKRLRTELVKDEMDVQITSNKTGSINKIKTYDIINSLKNIPDTDHLKKLFAKAHKRTKVLETPVPKHLSEKAQRIASYVQDKKEVSKWEPIVKKNRKMEQMVFPLKQPDYSMQTASSFTKAWKPETDLEKQVAELLKSSENNLKDQKLLTTAEQKAIETMNLEEMKQKRAEFLKLKAMQTYQEAKFKRLKSIKSKRYRKILRLEREKNEEKKLSAMEKDDPLQFKEVLKEMEKKRMMERMSQKHKNTSKWSKKQVIYGKFNDKAREQVHEQLDISKKLTQRIKEFEYDDSDGENKDDGEEEQKNSDLKSVLVKDGLLVNNPWIKMMSGVGGLNNKENLSKNENSVQPEYSKPKAYTNKKEIEIAQFELDNQNENEESDADYLDKSDIKELSKAFTNNETDDEDLEQEKKPVEAREKTIKVTKECQAVAEVEKEDFLLKNKSLIEEKPEEINIKPKNITIDNKSKLVPTKKSNNVAHLMTLTDAFADDDVIEEFKQEKKSVIENEKVKSIDLTLPGWGDWAGAGIDPSKIKKKKSNKRYRKKLIIRPSDVLTTKEDKEQMIRKDKDLDHVIISEKKDTKIAAFQISELPHQFKSVQEFESKIVQPIGRTWNPEHKFRKLTMPKVKTKMGSIIEPIDREDLVNNIKRS